MDQTTTTTHRPVLTVLVEMQEIRNDLDHFIQYHGDSVAIPHRRQLEEIARQLSATQRAISAGADA